MGLMDKMMDRMMGRMSKKEKEDLMGKMMDKFFSDMSAEDKQKMMEEMMPKMMEGVNMMEMMPKMMRGLMLGSEGQGDMMGMMSKMMGGGKEAETPMMPQMMMEMMPKCLSMIIPKIPKEKRSDYALELVATIIEKASEGLSEEEKVEFVAKVVEGLKSR